MLDAVIVHELAHLLEPNHSPRFRELESRYPAGTTPTCSSRATASGSTWTPVTGPTTAGADADAPDAGPRPDAGGRDRDYNWAVAFLLAALAALTSAVTSVLQRIGVESAPESSALRLSLMSHAIKRGIWLVGFALMLVQFGLQATALRFGELSVVQPVLTTELLFLLLILAVWFRYRLGAREWLGALPRGRRPRRVLPGRPTPRRPDPARPRPSGWWPPSSSSRPSPRASWPRCAGRAGGGPPPSARRRR